MDHSSLLLSAFLRIRMRDDLYRSIGVLLAQLDVVFLDATSQLIHCGCVLVVGVAVLPDLLNVLVKLIRCLVLSFDQLLLDCGQVHGVLDDLVVIWSTVSLLLNFFQERS